MTRSQVTARTKRAVRRWAGLPSNARVLLDDKLADLRPGGLNALLVKINGEFAGESGFPISANDWSNLSPKTVRNVRDEVLKRVGGSS